jgi:hypothetical protein
MSRVQLSLNVSDLDAVDGLPWEYYTVLEHVETP